MGLLLSWMNTEIELSEKWKKETDEKNEEHCKTKTVDWIKSYNNKLKQEIIKEEDIEKIKHKEQKQIRKLMNKQITYAIIDCDKYKKEEFKDEKKKMDIYMAIITNISVLLVIIGIIALLCLIVSFMQKGMVG